ncbi:ATP-dependent zinc metalloprotease FtsH [Planctomycetota bacterium]|nr:ATP-dependent zinc metalloprotease FtsH [Planctomycetota bacterium]
MTPEDNNKPDQPNKPQPPKSRGASLFFIVMGLFVVVLVYLAFDGSGDERKINSTELMTALAENNVESMKIGIPLQGNFYKVEGEYAVAEEGKSKSFQSEIESGMWEAWQRKQQEDPQGSPLKGVSIEISQEDNSFRWFLESIVPFIIILALVWFFFFRRAGGGMGGGVMGFGKSKAKMFSKEDVSVSFNDVAGADEAKEEVSEIVEFLRTPQRFTRLGAKIPKGVLLIGPPGCGKTLLAKAIAGEADRPFYSISGSDFVEMFVGVGASRVRDLFRNARENAPCIIFIDEIDAVGRRRGTGVGGGHDEREQTLNALLVEMDGIGSSEGVIILAATNRGDVLDNALLRPGRFDRQVYIDLPDLKGREEILSVHLNKVKAGKEVEPAEIAKLIPGFSGADIMNLVNESALIAVIRNLDEINRESILEARDRVAFGRQKRSKVMEEDERKLTAMHEAGHALVQESTLETDKVHKVTIIPRGQALGATMSLPDRDRYSMAQSRAKEMLMVMLGGRAAEHVMFGKIDAGAANDIKQATRISRKMVKEWGMSERLGLLNYEGEEDQTYGGQAVSKANLFSDETMRAIDEEMRRLVDEAWDRTLALLEGKKDTLQAIADALLKYETLDHEDLVTIISGDDIDAKREAELKDKQQKEAAQRLKRMEENPVERPSSDTGGIGTSEQPGTA